MGRLKKIDLIDLYYPAEETIATLLEVPPEQRETLLRRILPGTPGAENDRHISRLLATINALAGEDRS